MARLVLEASGASREEALRGFRILGRHQAVAGTALEDPRLSREHARISFDGRRWVLQDAGSKNGTCLNGRFLSGPAPLSDGDRIRIGDTVIVFADEAPAAAP